jgi:hypothetical protein
VYDGHRVFARGRLDKAHAIAARLRAITPQILPTEMPGVNPE